MSRRCWTRATGSPPSVRPAMSLTGTEGARWDPRRDDRASAKLRQDRSPDDAGKRPRLADQLEGHVSGRGKRGIVVREPRVAFADRPRDRRDRLSTTLEDEIGKGILGSPGWRDA